ncbi:MAG: molybdopterin molybdotransferase MoeA [Leucobacter sp.]
MTTHAFEARRVEDHLAAVERLLDPVVQRIRDDVPDVVALTDPAAIGRVCAVDIVTPIPLPPFDNSQMDGYAVRAADLAQAGPAAPVSLSLGAAVAAGDAPATHLPGTASPVMTGAPIPLGADAVVPVEATRWCGVGIDAVSAADAPVSGNPVSGDPVFGDPAGDASPGAAARLAPDPARCSGIDAHERTGFPPLARAGERVAEATIVFSAPVDPGAFVRPRGVDAAEGTVIAQAGQRLAPARIGALAAAGLLAAQVLRRPRVLLCTTGDELAGVADPRPGGSRSGGSGSGRAGPGGIGPGGIGPDSAWPGDAGSGDAAATAAAGSRLAPGRIHDANAPMLAALLRGAGAEVTAVRCGDRAGELRALLERAAVDADLVITSGGISMGAFEVVREALEPIGVEFGTVAMQPGGPQGLGELHLPAMPGANAAAPIPILCFPGNPVSSLLSAQLFAVPALRRLAGLPGERPVEQRPLAVDTVSPAGKLQLRRARLEADGSVTPLPPGSHLLHDLADADVIAEIPLGVAHAPAGTPVTTWRIA